jgi:hypothetical protein
VTVRVAIRALVASPVRSAVLACGFGFGIAVMAGLLGIGEVILEQARSPALEGGGDVVVTGAGGRLTSARFILSSVLEPSKPSGRVRAASPTSRARLYLMDHGRAVPVEARGGIPSLEKAVGDPETAAIAAWTDAPGDASWSDPDPADVLRAMDRFHPVPDVPDYRGSWAEWLYFNGRAGDNRFYLSFIAGPPEGDGGRKLDVRLQLDRGGRTVDYSTHATVSRAALLAGAPDLDAGSSRVRLEGLRYRITLGRYRDGSARAGTGPDLSGEVTLDAFPGRSFPPFTVRGADGWVSGYVVPALSGRLGGSLEVEGETVDLEGGTGYHDHNWGFWKGVTWQWGQVADEDLSIVYGRIRPPAAAADPERVPGLLVALGPSGPLGFSTNARITETDDPEAGRPRRIEVRARGRSLDLVLDLEVESAVQTRLGGGRMAPDGATAPEFLQMRAACRVRGRVGEREVDFTAPGSAETFRSGRQRP